MKRSLIIYMICFMFMTAYSQDENTNVDAPLGYRIKRNSKDYIIFKDKDLSPNPADYRKLNYRVYFRKVNLPPVDFKGKKYQLITIPGARRILPQNDQEKAKIVASNDYRIGAVVNEEDYDQNFWIEEDIIDKETNIEYYKYSNDFFSGLLTAPFKYRLKTGNAPESLLDGDFNIAPFIGWKWRISSTRPFYIAPFAFGGITSLDYNSQNNSAIAETQSSENGSGITYGGGISIRLGSISPGFLIGWDHGLGNLGSTYVYKDKPWISFSINYDFFKPSKTSENQAPANTKK